MAKSTDNNTALFESGNSRLHFSWWDSGRVIDTVSLPYPETSNALEDIIGDFFSSKTPDRIAACSVSSRWREILFQAIERKAPGKLVVARTVYDTGINVVYDKPETIGVDRVLAAHAAYRFFGLSMLSQQTVQYLADLSFRDRIYCHGHFLKKPICPEFQRQIPARE